MIYCNQAVETIPFKADRSIMDCHCCNIVENWREKQVFCGFATGLDPYSTEPPISTGWHHREGKNIIFFIHILMCLLHLSSFLWYIVVDWFITVATFTIVSVHCSTGNFKDINFTTRYGL
jgi:hypothetical protein